LLALLLGVCVFLALLIDGALEVVTVKEQLQMSSLLLNYFVKLNYNNNNNNNNNNIIIIISPSC
jgi:hypothetical protein